MNTSYQNPIARGTKEKNRGDLELIIPKDQNLTTLKCKYKIWKMAEF
jgi:hypothetical protein